MALVNSICYLFKLDVNFSRAAALETDRRFHAGLPNLQLCSLKCDDHFKVSDLERCLYRFAYTRSIQHGILINRVVQSKVQAKLLLLL
jgi:hypothetical protein